MDRGVCNTSHWTGRMAHRTTRREKLDGLAVEHLRCSGFERTLVSYDAAVPRPRVNHPTWHRIC